MKGAFSIKSKKTPYQRHKEAEEEKKRKADEEAAKVYEEFVESFKADDGPSGGGRDGGSGVKAFVRGGVVAPGSKPHEAPSGGSTGSRYVPAGAAAAAAGAAAGAGSAGGGGGKRFEPGRVHQRHDAFADDEDEEEESVFKLPSKKAAADKDKPRQIDRMLEQLKSEEQEEREERDRLRREGKPVPPESSFDGDGYGDRGGGFGGGGRGGGDNYNSYDDGDPFTTNLYVGNIHPEVNEAHLAREFGRFGPIGSVKIMWPRDEEQRRRGRNCGFVAYMTRPDAEAARKALDGLVLHGMEMRVGWGKAVPLPPVPLYSGHGVPTGPLTAIVPPAVTRERNNPLTLAMQSAMVPAQGMYAKESTMSRETIKGAGTDIEVKVPEDAKQRFVIDSLALYVLKDGCEFEQLIMMEAGGRPELAFLFDLDAPEHAYYRWRLYSLAEGDTLRTWRIDPFIMVEGGQLWVPPPMLAADIAAGEKRQELTAQRGQAAVLLSDYDRDRLEDMLRGLTAERGTIADAMVFALENADAAGDVVEVLEEALTLPETPPSTKLARLFLVNDILANATAPVRNASRYRGRLEACLPEVFVSFHGTHKACESRMVQDALRRAVLRLLRVWRHRYIFNDNYINGLQATFLGAIPILEEAEEEEQRLQQEAAAAAAAAAANGTGDDDGAAPAGRSRWEAMEAEEEEEAARQKQQQQQERQQHKAGTCPTRAQLRLIHPPLTAELEGLASEELERKCRVAGLSNKGSRALCVERLLALDYYLHADERGPLPVVDPSRPAAAAAGTAGAAGAAGGSSSKWQVDVPTAAADAARSGKWSSSTLAVPLGGVSIKQESDGPAAGAAGAAGAAAAAAAAANWQVVDEAAEREAQPQGPISKWLQEEADAEAARRAVEDKAQQEATAAAAAAAAKEATARAAIAAAATGGLGGGDGGGSGGGAKGGGASAADAAMEEERRKRLRQIEVRVLDHQEDLQEKGQSAAAAEAAAAALRQQLVAQLDAELQQQAAAAAAAKAAAADKGGQEDREQLRSRDRDERDKGERDRDRDRDKDSRSSRSQRKRSRSRSRSPRKSLQRSDSARTTSSRGSDRQRGDRDSRDGGTTRSSRRSSRSRSRSRERRRSSRSGERRRSRSRSRSRSPDKGRSKRHRS